MGLLAVAAEACSSGHTCYREAVTRERLTGTMALTLPSGRTVSGPFDVDGVSGASQSPTDLGPQANATAGGSFSLQVSTWGELTVTPIGPPGTYPVAPPQLCIRACPGDHPFFDAGQCESFDGGSFDSVAAPGDCLTVTGTLVVTAHETAPGPAGFNVSADRVNFDLTIPQQASSPLSGEFAFDYETTITSSEESFGSGCQ